MGPTHTADRAELAFAVAVGILVPLTALDVTGRWWWVLWTGATALVAGGTALVVVSGVRSIAAGSRHDRAANRED